MNQVRAIYDRLFEFEKGKKKGQIYPIHKALLFSEQFLQSGISDISDLIRKELPAGKELKILDAGCGIGYSLLQIGKKKANISGLGISLSEKEIKQAKKFAVEFELDDRIKFQCKSYDEPFDEKFDSIICLESLKHAPNWKKTLSNLGVHLNPGGSLFIIEDFYTQKRQNRMSRNFQKSWGIANLFNESEMRITLSKFGFRETTQIDLTEFVIQKQAIVTKIKELMMRVIIALFPNNQLKTLLQIYQGALIMDYFYARKYFSYHLLHLQKREKTIDRQRK